MIWKFNQLQFELNVSLRIVDSDEWLKIDKLKEKLKNWY